MVLVLAKRFVTWQLLQVSILLIAPNYWLIILNVIFGYLNARRVGMLSGFHFLALASVFGLV